MKGTGGTGGNLDLSAVASGPLHGHLRVEPKHCELCGRMFFRDGRQKECKSCAARLMKPEAPPPPNISAETERKMERRHTLRWMEAERILSMHSARTQ